MFDKKCQTLFLKFFQIIEMRFNNTQIPILCFKGLYPPMKHVLLSQSLVKNNTCTEESKP